MILPQTRIVASDEPIVCLSHSKRTSTLTCSRCCQRGAPDASPPNSFSSACGDLQSTRRTMLSGAFPKLDRLTSALMLVSKAKPMACASRPDGRLTGEKMLLIRPLAAAAPLLELFQQQALRLSSVMPALSACGGSLVSDLAHGKPFPCFDGPWPRLIVGKDLIKRSQRSASPRSMPSCPMKMCELRGADCLLSKCRNDPRATRPTNWS